MQPRKALLMRVLLNKYAKSSPDAFFEPLHSDTVQAVIEQDTQIHEIDGLFQPEAEKLQRIHYSWILPILQELPEEARVVLVTVLPSPQKERLKEALQIKELPKNIAAPVGTFLREKLYKRIRGGNDHLPLQLLPPSPLLSLIELNKNELIELADLLGLQELAEELRAIVDKNLLQAVYAALTPKEQHFLKQFLHKKGKVPTSTLGVDRWNKDPSKLRHVIQSRGLTRLAKGISGQASELLWIVSHTLDSGRGHLLMKSYSHKPVHGMTPYLAQQIQILMPSVKQKSSE